MHQWNLIVATLPNWDAVKMKDQPTNKKKKDERCILVTTKIVKKQTKEDQNCLNANLKCCGLKLNVLEKKSDSTFKFFWYIAFN